MRKVEMFVVTSENPNNRDNGKRLVIQEMPALQAEKWAMRALLALAKSGVELPDDAVGAGFAALAMAGFQALRKLEFADAEPLMDEMLDCVQIVPDPKVPENMRPLVRNSMEGDDIEEVSTLWDLRERIFKLHTQFFFPARR